MAGGPEGAASQDRPGGLPEDSQQREGADCRQGGDIGGEGFVFVVLGMLVVLEFIEKLCWNLFLYFFKLKLLLSSFIRPVYANPFC